MQNHAADKLYTEMAEADGSPGCLPHNGVGFRKDIIQRLARLQPLLEFRCLRLQLFIRKLLHLRFHAFDFIHDGNHTLHFAFTVSSNHFTQ